MPEYEPVKTELRGQKLFVRPIEAADFEAVGRFLQKEDGYATSGLLGKLVGDIVAVVEIHLTSDAIQIDNVFVARDLRRKRIGRFMLDEVEQLASKMDRSRLIVGEPSDAAEFFRRTGFEREGARWIRYVRSQSAERTTR